MRPLNARKRRKQQGAKRIVHDIMPSEKRSEEEQRLLNIALFNSTLNGNITGMKLALKGGADMNMKATGLMITPLHAAAIHQQDKACAFLIKKGADVYANDDRGHTPLQKAISWGNRTEIVHMLAEAMAHAIVGKEKRIIFVSSFRACVSS